MLRGRSRLITQGDFLRLTLYFGYQYIGYQYIGYRHIMAISTESASVYTDLNGLDQLKYQLKGDSVDDLRVVARQFEAIFVQQMLKTMRDASLSEGLFDSNNSDFYVDMLDKQMSLNLSAGKGIGLADIIVNQLSSQLGIKPEDNGQVNQAPSSMQAPLSQPLLGSKDDNAQSIPDKAVNAAPISLQPGGFLSDAATKNITDPETFIKSLWPLAVNAAKEIGVSPQVLIAQAALETGWGQHIARDEHGNSSHNVFNIKAGASWQGATITRATTEFKNGAALKEYAAFRVYDSFNGAFEDYVSLVKHNPRYQQALENAASEKDYAVALHNAGYATDPDYSAKILRIANGETMANVSGAFNSQNVVF
jgi:flagellar protein FlgJ